MTNQATSNTLGCWCGGPLQKFSEQYQRCQTCGTLVYPASLAELATLSAADGFYGRDYWTTHQTQVLHNPPLAERARLDLPERCLYWLQTLVKHQPPPARVLEIGAGHGGLTAVLRWAGYEAQALELNAWAANFAQETFEIPIHKGSLSTFQAENNTFDVIILMDVLEHLTEPLSTLRLCTQFLKPDGFILLQTPNYPFPQTCSELTDNHDPFLKMLLPLEHLYLFNQTSLGSICEQAGLSHLHIIPPLFAYDMFAIASKKPLTTYENPHEQLLASASGRLVVALLDLYAEKNTLHGRLQESEADRAARLDQINALSKRLQESELDRAKRLEQIEELTKLLMISEADRSARAEQIDTLTALVKSLQDTQSKDNA